MEVTIPPRADLGGEGHDDEYGSINWTRVEAECARRKVPLQRATAVLNGLADLQAECDFALPGSVEDTAVLITAYWAAHSSNELDLRCTTEEEMARVRSVLASALAWDRMDTTDTHAGQDVHMAEAQAAPASSVRTPRGGRGRTRSRTPVGGRSRSDATTACDICHGKATSSRDPIMLCSNSRPPCHAAAHRSCCGLEVEPGDWFCIRHGKAIPTCAPRVGAASP